MPSGSVTTMVVSGRCPALFQARAAAQLIQGHSKFLQLCHEIQRSAIASLDSSRLRHNIIEIFMEICLEARGLHDHNVQWNERGNCTYAYKMQSITEKKQGGTLGPKVVSHEWGANEHDTFVENVGLHVPVA